jgi:hypothetical protein
LPVTELKQNIYKQNIYSIFGRIYYKKDSNSTTSHILKKIEIPPIYHILNITKGIPFPPIDTSSSIKKGFSRI